jgi:hypothetical protein
MTDRRPKHAVIGAGFSGLGVAAALKRRGVPFDLLEADDDVGGNWYHGVYEGAHIISSRRTTEYADFPMPAHWPDFPSGAQMLEYLRAFAEKLGLRDHLELRTQVERVEPAAGGSWTLTLAGQARRLYGGVVVCNGHHWDRRFPSYPGRFSGEMLHSKDYKQNGALRGRRVLVIGGGNSACDIAVEAARVAAASHLSLRRGYWFLPKTALGVPTVELLRPWMPVWLQRRMVKALVRVIVGRYQQYGLPPPDHEPFEKHPTINSELLHCLRHGRVVPHPDVRRFDGDMVEFADGVREPFDLVVAATGFHVSFPFVAEGVVRWRDGMPVLVGGVLPPDHRNLYFFGLGQPRYGAGPLVSAGAELLCDMIEVQKRLRHPLGALLWRLGQRPPDTWLIDPFLALRRVRAGRRLVPALPYLEPWIMRGAA